MTQISKNTLPNSISIAAHAQDSGVELIPVKKILFLKDVRASRKLLCGNSWLTLGNHTLPPSLPLKVKKTFFLADIRAARAAKEAGEGKFYK
jgi:hypothetical protein